MSRLAQLQQVEQSYKISFKSELQKVTYGQLLEAFQDIEKKWVAQGGDVVYSLYKEKLGLQEELTRIEKETGIYEINTQRRVDYEKQVRDLLIFMGEVCVLLPNSILMLQY